MDYPADYKKLQPGGWEDFSRDLAEWVRYHGAEALFKVDGLEQSDIAVAALSFCADENHEAVWAVIYTTMVDEINGFMEARAAA